LTDDSESEVLIACLHHYGEFPGSTFQKTATFSTFLLFVIMGDTNELSYVESQSLEEQEDQSQRPSCFVGTVGPQAVCSSRDAQYTCLVQDERWKWIPKVYTGPYFFLAIKIQVFNKIIPCVHLYIFLFSA
jgi:hypothetical protein